MHATMGGRAEVRQGGPLELRYHRGELLLSRGDVWYESLGANGWNLSGDSYVRDADGYFWYQARTDDMIISAGYNISGPEVENVLLLHPKVKEVAVVGLPDPQRGQAVSAFVVPRDCEGSPELCKELQDFVKREIAPYKYPRRVEFVAELPRTATGKLQRYRLRESR